MTQNRAGNPTNQSNFRNIRTQSKARGKMCEREPALIMKKFLIEWQSGARLFIQSYREKATQTLPQALANIRVNYLEAKLKTCSHAGAKEEKCSTFLLLLDKNLQIYKVVPRSVSSIRLTDPIADVSWSFSVLGTNSNQEANSCKHKYEKTINGILSLQ